jgi:hypothetical protein
MAAGRRQKRVPVEYVDKDDEDGKQAPGTTLDEFNTFIQQGSLGHNRHAMVSACDHISIMQCLPQQ